MKWTITNMPSTMTEDGDVLGCFGMEMDDLEKMGLEMVYQLARKKHFDHMREWGVF